MDIPQRITFFVPNQIIFIKGLFKIDKQYYIMIPKLLTSKIRNSKYPYHLVQEDLETPVPFYPDETESINQLKILLNSLTHIDSSDQRKPSLNKPSTLQNLEIIKLIELDQTSSNETKNNPSKLDALLLDYLTNDTFPGSTSTRKVKCGSVERLGPEDLCVFYRYSTLLKKTKKIVNSLLILRYHYLL